MRNQRGAFRSRVCSPTGHRSSDVAANWVGSSPSWCRLAPASFRVVLLSGEAGIGKTTLLAAFARAQDGECASTVLYGRCDDGAAVPLQPFRDVVGSLVDCAPEEVLRAHCERFGGELARIAPHLLNRVQARPPTTGDEATERYQLFESVADLLRRLATTGPADLLLDDLHWAEPTALLLLRHLARALIDVPVLVVASFRDTEELSRPTPRPRSPIWNAAMPVASRSRASTMRSSPIWSCRSSSAVCSPSKRRRSCSCREQTAGNPLYAVQLVRHLLESGRLVVGRRGRASRAS